MSLEPKIETSEVKKQPVVKVHPLVWIKENLFSSWLNGVITVFFIAVLFFILKGTITFVINGNWTVISSNFKLLMVGQYPVAELWRVWTSLTVVSLLVGLSFGVYKGFTSILYYSTIAIYIVCASLPFITMPTRMWLIANIALVVIGWAVGRKVPKLKKFTWIGWILAFPIAVFLLHGFGVLTVVKTNVWGGFLLTLLIALVAIFAAFPLGVLLALGRTSKLPIIRWMSIIYIELIRGVPLITVLFMAQIMIPLFLPQGITFDNVVRVMIGFTLFNAAYIAENVRGGLQAIPKSQYEASHALGLNTWKMTTFIILPQALRITVPSMVGQSISIFKDVTLIAIVGLVDLLGIGRTIISNPQFLGTQMEVFLFVAFVFWIFCYLMSQMSRRIEKSLNVSR